MKHSDKATVVIIKGLFSIVIGLLLVAWASSIILQMVAFIGGLVLIYYGLTILNISSINSTITIIKKHIQQLLP